MGLFELRPRVKPRTVEDGLLSITTGPELGCCMVQLFGELDLSNVGTLDAELARVEAGGFDTLVVDLSGLHFIDSAGISCLLRAGRRSDKDGKSLRVLRGSAEVDRLLRLAGLDRVLSYLD
jgi:anti-sigma B factor antagonist